jgi:hypothetical protein
MENRIGVGNSLVHPKILDSEFRIPDFEENEEEE